MHLVVREAERGFEWFRQRRSQQGPAVVPATLVPRQGPHAHALQHAGQPKRVQHTRRVRTDLDAGADLAQGRRLLVDLDVDTCPKQRHGGGETTNPRAYHANAHAPIDVDAAGLIPQAVVCVDVR